MQACTYRNATQVFYRTRMRPCAGARPCSAYRYKAAICKRRHNKVSPTEASRALHNACVSSYIYGMADIGNRGIATQIMTSVGTLRRMMTCLSLSCIHHTLQHHWSSVSLASKPHWLPLMPAHFPHLRQACPKLCTPLAHGDPVPDRWCTRMPAGTFPYSRRPQGTPRTYCGTVPKRLL